MLKKIYILYIFIILKIFNIFDKFNSLPILNKMVFKTHNGLNLVYYNDNFYITNQPVYTFVSELYVSGLYLLKNTLGTKNMTLNYDISNTSYSKIILKTPLDNNSNTNTISNIFNPTNSNIYFDYVNKVIMSNDNLGTKIYLTNKIINSPVSWNYNIDNATIFDFYYP